MFSNKLLLVPDLASLPLQFFLNFNPSRLALDDRASKDLILLVDRFDLGLVVADLILHVADLAPQVPRMAPGGPTPTCTQQHHQQV